MRHQRIPEQSLINGARYRKRTADYHRSKHARTAHFENYGFECSGQTAGGACDLGPKQMEKLTDGDRETANREGDEKQQQQTNYGETKA